MTSQPSQDAAARALAAQNSRLQAERDRQQQAADKARDTAFYRGQGEYSSLGADGQYRPRGSVTSGGAAVGQQVPASGGLMGGMPAGDSGDGAGLRSLAERVAEVAQSSGPQIGTLNPNNGVATPRYPQDHYYQDGARVLWQWRATVGAVAGKWEAISTDVQVLDAAPTVPPASSKAVAFVRSPKETYVWDSLAAAPAWLGPYGGGGGGGVQIAVRNFENINTSQFSLQPLAWSGATRVDDFSGTFPANGEISLPSPGWYRVSLQFGQDATDNGSERQIAHEFTPTLKDGLGSTVALGESTDKRILTFAGWNNFDPGTGQTDWVFQAATSGKLEIVWAWNGVVTGGSITDAYIFGRAMLEKLN